MARHISNQVLYDLIRDFKVDVDRRFEYMEKNSELRFSQIEKTLDEHSKILAEHGEALAEIAKSNGKVKISFSRSFALFIAFMSAMISGTMVYSFNNK